MRATPVGTLGAALLIAAIAIGVTVKPWTGNEIELPAARLALAVVALGAAFAFDDPAAPTIAASPTPLPRRRALRTLVVLALAIAGLVVLGAGAAALADEAPAVPAAAVVLEGTALLCLGLAASAVRIRRAGPTVSGGPAAITAIVTLMIAAQLIGHRFARWSLLASPHDHAWTSSRWAWAAIGSCSLLVVAWLSRDPAGRPFARSVAK